jgi:hypothetical protein
MIKVDIIHFNFERVSGGIKEVVGVKVSYLNKRITIYMGDETIVMSLDAWNEINNYIQPRE